MDEANAGSGAVAEGLTSTAASAAEGSASASASATASDRSSSLSRDAPSTVGPSGPSQEPSVTAGRSGSAGSNADFRPSSGGHMLRDWLLGVARISVNRIDAALKACEMHEIDSVDDLKVHHRAGKLESLFTSTTALKIAEALSSTTVMSAPSNSSLGSGGPHSDYDDVRQLGRGAFGTTWLAVHRPTSRQVAIKRMMKDSMLEANQALQEILKMVKLKHERLVEATDVWMDNLGFGSFRVNIVMEYCDGGDLSQHLQQHAPLSESDVYKFMRQSLEALQFIHANGMAHRDVKPANLLLRRGDIKLGDLGLAKQVDVNRSSLRPVGTLGYMAPEVFEGRAGTSADIWALGIMGTELASSVTATMSTVSEAQVKTRLSLIPQEYNPAFKRAVAGALQLDPEQRPTAQTLLRSPPFGSGGGGGQPGVVTMDASALRSFIDGSAWMAPLRVPGVPWVRENPAGGASHRVQMCDCSTDGPSSEAATRLHKLITGVPGNYRFHELYSVQKTVLCDCYGRSAMMASHAMDLNTRLANASLFSLDEALAAGDEAKRAARLAVLSHFQDKYPSLCRPMDGMDHVRVWVAFHVAPSEEVARSVLRGNFAVLQKLDAGFYGQGIYLTLDADYAIEAYGRQLYRQYEVPLLVCAVVVGNAYPVVEMPRAPDGFMGRAFNGIVDAHVVVVSKGVDPYDAQAQEWYMPTPHTEWDAQRTHTELVIKDDSQVLPLGYVMVRPSDATELLAEIGKAEDEMARLQRGSLQRASELQHAMADLPSAKKRAAGRAAEWRRRRESLHVAGQQGLEQQLAALAKLNMSAHHEPTAPAAADGGGVSSSGVGGSSGGGGGVSGGVGGGGGSGVGGGGGSRDTDAGLAADASLLMELETLCVNHSADAFAALDWLKAEANETCGWFESWRTRPIPESAVRPRRRLRAAAERAEAQLRAEQLQTEEALRAVRVALEVEAEVNAARLDFEKLLQAVRAKTALEGQRESELACLVELGATRSLAAELLASHGDLEVAADALVKRLKPPCAPPVEWVAAFAAKVGVASVDSLSRATRLNWAHRQLGPPDCAVLAHLVYTGVLDSVEELHMYENAAGDEGVQLLARALSHRALRRLTVLGLQYNRVGDAGLSALADALSHRFTLHCNAPGWQSQRESASFGALDALAELSLQGNGISAGGISALARALEHGSALKALHKLVLSNNDVGADGAESLAGMISSGGLSALRVLSVHSASIGDDGMCAIAEALTLPAAPHLEELLLQSNGFGDAGMLALLDAIGAGALPTLRELQVWGNELGEDSYSALAAAVKGGSLGSMKRLVVFAPGSQKKSSSSRYIMSVVQRSRGADVALKSACTAAKIQMA